MPRRSDDDEGEELDGFDGFDDSDDSDEDDELDGDAADSAQVTCPYCGESSVIALDPTGGDDQEYVEDCPVCCRPWNVHVQFDDNGAATVSLGGGD